MGQSMSVGKQVGLGSWMNTRMLGRIGGLLRNQVLLTLFALDILGLRAGHVNIGGVGAVLQQVVEWIQVILRL